MSLPRKLINMQKVKIMLNKIVFLLLLISVAACNCTNIDCVPPPPSLGIKFLDAGGNNLMGSGDLTLQEVDLIPLGKSNTIFSTSYDEIIDFTLENTSTRYLLKVKNITIDTFTIDMVENKGECCTNF